MKPTYLPAYKVWTESVKRKQISEVIFSPQDKEGTFNLWSKIPCVAKKPKGSLITDIDDFNGFITESLCAGDESKSKWLLDWSAQMFQEPHKKATLVPVMIGPQGTGKGLFADHLLSGMLGHFATKILTARTLKERFNAEQAFKFLTIIDEASWGGDHEEDGILKGLTGSDLMVIEEKFGARLTIPNYSRYIILSNNQQAVRLELSNRRYLIIECSQKYKGNEKYFGPFWKMVRNPDFLSAYHGFLMERDITNFKRHTLPNTTAGREAKLASSGVVAKFWYDVLFEDPQEIFVDGAFLPKKTIYEKFLRYAQNVKSFEKNLTNAKFWGDTKNILGINGQFDARPRLNDGKRPRALEMDAHQFMSKFCDGLKIARPKDFDDLDFFQSMDDFMDDPLNFN